MYSPVAGATMGSRYLGGFRSSGGHSGIDFPARHGSIIRAVAPGRVVSVGFAGAYGILTKVRHTDGTIGLYAHQSGTYARVGQTVSRGSLIGKVGSTGNSTGPHVHFEVRRNGSPVNPMPWLSANYNAVSPRGGSVVSGGAAKAGRYGGQKLSAEQLRNAATIIAVGRSMGASQRDLVISLMTAFQESRLKNLNYGHSDSLGLFQQRPSQGWGSPSQVTNPQYAARKFFSTLFRVSGRSRMSLTGAAQAVQRSAFPNAYAKWQSLAEAILGGTAGSMKGGRAAEQPLDTFAEEEPLDGMFPRTSSGGFPTEAVQLPGAGRSMLEQDFNTDQMELRRLLYG